MNPDIDFSNIRAEGGDRREGFEEFSAQIFRRRQVTSGSSYERYRGAGGDGGVEAIWRLPTGKVVGLQSKFFLTLKSGHLAQLEKSLETALDNFPNLESYIVTLPLDPTPSVKARDGKGQAEKLEEWRKSLIARAAARGSTIEVVWWCASELKSRLLGMDHAAGRILYWFGTPILDRASLETALQVAEGIAGPRYSPNLQVGTDAGDTLRAFGLEPGWSKSAADFCSSLREAVRVWTDRAPQGHSGPSGQILAALSDALDRFAKIEDLTFVETDRVALQALGTATLPIAQTLEDTLKAEFDSTHGPESDTPRWRQFQAAYQVSFPAAALDLARDACALFRDIVTFADTSAAKAAGASVLLMRGAAGIGKTHSIIDATKERVAQGRASMAILGQELISGRNLWNVVAEKLEVGPTASKSEVIGALAAYAESTGAPFVLMVDAINETPDRQRWRAWLPQLKADLVEQPIRLLLSCRDIFVEDALGSGETGLVSFSHAGFAGREYDAAYAFASFYKVGPPAEVVAQPEFANPLFLHLVCRAAVTRKWARIPGGQVGLTSLVSAILDGANEAAAKLLDHDVRLENPVRDGAMALAKSMGQQAVRHLRLVQAQDILKGVWPSSGASTSLLRAMEEADLISVASENGAHVMRFAFERLGDLLIAQASVEGQTTQDVGGRFLSGDLASLVATADAVASNAGLVQAYSILLPEMFDIEVADLLQSSATHREVRKLALGVLIWRDIASFTNTGWVLRNDTWQDLIEMFDPILAVAAVPGHPLNAEWLNNELRRYSPTDRDVVWTKTVKLARDRAGPGYQLTRIARTQNLSHMSVDSAELLGIALSWATASADLLIRDEASQALTRLLLAQPVAVALLERFIGFDDDYIRERLLVAVYGAGLLRKDPTYWHDVAEITFDGLFARGTSPESVLLRDMGRQIVEEADAAGKLPGSASLSAVRPPYSSPWPLQFTFANWSALEAAHPELPANLNLESQIAPDFTRYCVEPAIRGFELATVGLTNSHLNQWIVEQILALGYDGKSKLAMGYDHELIHEHGDGRGVPSRHRRVSKKYQWIFLNRLMGRLNDHVARRTSPWEPAPSAAGLHGVRFRTFDPTDLFDGRGAAIAGIEPADLFLAPSAITGDQDPPGWTAALLPSQDAQLLGDEWALLAGDQTWRHEDGTDGLQLRKTCRVSATLVRNTKMSALRKSLRESEPVDDIPEFHRVFYGEYPSSAAFQTNPDHWSIARSAHGAAASAILRGSDSSETPTHDLWAPASDLINSTKIAWDGVRGWVDGDRVPVAAQIGSGDNVALIFTKERLAEYLLATRSTLVWIVSETRQASKDYDPIAYIDRFQAWSWNGEKLAKIVEKNERYPAESEKEEDIDPDDEPSGKAI